jgi:RHS repeat-associated protein
MHEHCGRLGYQPVLARVAAQSPAVIATPIGGTTLPSVSAGVSATASIVLKPAVMLTAGAAPVHQVSGSVANGAAGAGTVGVPKPAGVNVGAVLIASVAASDVTMAGGGTTVNSEGFESGAVGDWSPWISPATITVTTVQARTGTKSLQMNPTATQSNSQVFPAYTAGVVNTMTGWIKGTAGGVVSPTFSSYDAAWATLNQTSGTNITLTGAWQQWTATYTVPAATAHFGISFQKLDTTAWWIDDFTITTGSGGTAATTVTAPAGWSAVTTGSAAGVQLTTWSHVVAAGDPASWTFTLSQTARAAGAVSSYTGVDTVTAVDATGTGTNVSGVTHTAPSVNTGGANRLGITITAPTAITTMTPPSGSTERADQAGGATAPTVSIETSDFPIAVAGASGTKQTISVAAATSLTATIALRPVSTTGGSTANTTTSITKFYRSGGATVALRRDGTITWLLGDIQGGIAVSVPNGPGLTGVQRQRYLPYGQRRGSNLAASGTNSNDNITTTDHGFLGQVEDNTGLDYLNNRYHDPTLGRFISVDPLINVTHDAYGYGTGNPETYSDPSGLISADRAGEQTEKGGACRNDGPTISCTPNSKPKPGSGGPGTNGSEDSFEYCISPGHCKLYSNNDRIQDDLPSDGSMDDAGRAISEAISNGDADRLLANAAGAPTHGYCGDVNVFAVVGVGANGCGYVSSNGFFTSRTFYNGFGFGAGVNGIAFISNAARGQGLQGQGACMSISATIGVGICAGLKKSDSGKMIYNHVVTAFYSLGAGTPYSGEMTKGTTEVSKPGFILQPIGKGAVRLGDMAMPDAIWTPLRALLDQAT